MSSQSSSVHPVIRDFVDGLLERYTTSAREVGGPVYTELASLSGQIRDAVESPDAVGELRALAWRTPSVGVGEVVTTMAAMVEVRR